MSRARKVSERPSWQEKRKQEKLTAFLDSIPGMYAIDQERGYGLALTIILGFVRIVIEENLFRYLLGLIVTHTSLTTTTIANLAKVSFDVVRAGKKEVDSGILPDVSRQRHKGAGRKKITDEKPWLTREIVKYVELRSYGPCTKAIADYTAATLDSIQSFLKRHFNIKISRGTIRGILIAQDIKLRTNKKLLYGNAGKETDTQKLVRHAQFDYIDSIMSEKMKDPSCILLSIDCKQKINLGVTFASGKSYSKAGDEVKCGDHNFFIPLKVSTLQGMDDLMERNEGKAIPYGIYDIRLKKGYVNIGISSDTPEFVTESLRVFLPEIKKDHPQAKELYLFCDGGGSNSAKSHVLKYYLTLFSYETGMKIFLVHYPPYRSKFNKIERMVFAPLSKQYERCHLSNLLTVKTLTENTTTKKGLAIKARIDTGIYETGRKLTEEEIALIRSVPTGNTKKLSTQLAFEIDGTALDASDIPSTTPRKSVFDITENIHQTKLEKEAAKAAREAAKAEKVAEQARKKAEKAAEQARKKAEKAAEQARKKAEKKSSIEKQKSAKGANGQRAKNADPNNRKQRQAI